MFKLLALALVTSKFGLDVFVSATGRIAARRIRSLAKPFLAFRDTLLRPKLTITSIDRVCTLDRWGCKYSLVVVKGGKTLLRVQISRVLSVVRHALLEAWCFVGALRVAVAVACVV